MNPFARVVSSLANAILDLGLPTIRGWLRERLGDRADVANVTTDGSVVSLEDVRIPIGPRGLVVLARAAATITSLGEAGPALRLHSFDGVLVFGPAEAPVFRAEIAFAADDDPEIDAWIWGDVAIRNATWSSSADAGSARALHGVARLFVGSKTWRLEGGRLDGGPSAGTDAKPPVVAHFAAAGDLETGAAPVATAALALEHARIGPFLDAAAALTGTSVELPRYVSREAHLDGELSWSSALGARADVSLGASGVLAKGQASCAADGSALAGRNEGNVGVTAFLARLGVPEAALPSAADTLRVSAELAGSVRAPEVQIEARAPTLGFRFGRPRFVPAATLRDGAGTFVLKDGRVTGTAKLLAGSCEIRVVVDGERVAVNADKVEAAFLRDIACALRVSITIPDDLHAGVAMTYDGALGGTVSLVSTTSRLVAQLGTPIRVTGGVTAEDVVATGVLANAAVFPSHGQVVVALDIAVEPALTVRGSVAAAGKLELTVNHRPDMPPYVALGAHADVSVDRHGLRFESLRFTGHGGRFAGHGGSSERAPYLVLQLIEGGAPLADALLLLAPPTSRPALKFPDDLRWSGTLTLGDDLAIDAKVLTGKGTHLDVAVRLHHGDLSGSTARGSLAVADLLSVTSWNVPIAHQGLLVGDADITAGLVYRIAASSARLHVPPIALDDVSASIVVANGDVLWNRAEARLADGRLSSFGVSRKSGELSARVSVAAVAVHELPAIEGKTPSAYVRGRASGSAMLHKGGAGADLEARGDVVLDEAAFPVIDRARPALERYGLRPPNEDATGPAVATVTLDGRGVYASDISVSLHGAAVRGDVGMTNERALVGKIEIVLEEEYLRTSKVLTLPRVLGERLVIPVRIAGTTQKADIHAELRSDARPLPPREQSGRLRRIGGGRSAAPVPPVEAAARRTNTPKPAPELGNPAPRRDRRPRRRLDGAARTPSSRGLNRHAAKRAKKTRSLNRHAAKRAKKSENF